MIFKGIRKSFQNILYVSRISNVKNKKLKILSSLALSNLSVLFDIFIILYFSYLLSDKNKLFKFDIQKCIRLSS